MAASFFVAVEITPQIIWEKEQPENGKHDEQLQQDDYPHLPSPFRHKTKTIVIEPENALENVFLIYHKMLTI
jgi:predicted Zn-dependent protease with MMP-like domain